MSQEEYLGPAYANAFLKSCAAETRDCSHTQNVGGSSAVPATNVLHPQSKSFFWRAGPPATLESFPNFCMHTQPSREGPLLTPFQLQTGAFWASLGTSLGLSAGLALLFCLIRPRNNLVYAPRLKNADKDHAPPPIGNGLFSWVAPVRHATEPYLMEKIGLDAVVFLRVTRMLRNMFLILGLVGIAVMIPVNITQSNKAITKGLDAFKIMTPLYVWGGGLWAQVVVAWLIDLVVIYLLWHNYRRIHKLRRTYLESPEYQRSLHARTLLIRDIPAQFRNNEGIARLTEEVNSTGAVPRTTVGRNVKVLPDLIEDHEKAVKQLESLLAKYLRNPDKLPPNRPMIKAPSKYRGQTTGGKVDAIDYLTDRIRALEMEISDVRDRVDNRDAMPYGFASWEEISQAHSVAFQARSKRPHGAKIRLAPRPNDLIWNNLKLSRASRKTKRIMNIVWITALTIVWTPINAGIAIFLSNLANLGLVWPTFKTQLEAHHTAWSVVQGIAALPSHLFSTWYFHRYSESCKFVPATSLRPIETATSFATCTASSRSTTWWYSRSFLLSGSMSRSLSSTTNRTTTSGLLYGRANSFSSSRQRCARFRHFGSLGCCNAISVPRRISPNSGS